MKKTFTRVWCLIALALATVMVTSCGDEEKREAATERTAYVTLLIPQHPNALNYIDELVTITGDNTSAQEQTLTISSSDFVDYSSLSSTGQTLAYVNCQYCPDSTKYCEKQITVASLKNTFTISLKAIAKTGTTTATEKVSYCTGFCYSTQFSSGAVRLGGNVFGYTGTEYSHFIELLNGGELNSSESVSATTAN